MLQSLQSFGAVAIVAHGHLEIGAGKTSVGRSPGILHLETVERRLAV